jgi:hypothetical protein
MRKYVSIVRSTCQFSPTFSQYACLSDFIEKFFNDVNSDSPFSPYILQLETEPALQAEFKSELLQIMSGSYNFYTTYLSNALKRFRIHSLSVLLSSFLQSVSFLFRSIRIRKTHLLHFSDKSLNVYCHPNLYAQHQTYQFCTF